MSAAAAVPNPMDLTVEDPRAAAEAVPVKSGDLKIISDNKDSFWNAATVVVDPVYDNSTLLPESGSGGESSLSPNASESIPVPKTFESPIGRQIEEPAVYFTRIMKPVYDEIQTYPGFAVSNAVKKIVIGVMVAEFAELLSKASENRDYFNEVQKTLNWALANKWRPSKEWHEFVRKVDDRIVKELKMQLNDDFYYGQEIANAAAEAIVMLVNVQMTLSRV